MGAEAETEAKEEEEEGAEVELVLEAAETEAEVIAMAFGLVTESASSSKYGSFVAFKKIIQGALVEKRTMNDHSIFHILRGDRRHRLLLGGAHSRYSLELEAVEESLLRSLTAATTARTEVHWDEAGTNGESEEELEMTEGEDNVELSGNSGPYCAVT